MQQQVERWFGAAAAGDTEMSPHLEEEEQLAHLEGTYNASCVPPFGGVLGTPN